MTSLNIFGFTITGWILFFAMYVLWIVVFLFIKVIFYARIRRIAAKTKSNLDDIFLDALNRPLVIFIFVSGAAVLQRLINFEGSEVLSQYFFSTLKISTVLGIVLFAERFLSALVVTYSSKFDFLQSSGGIVRGIIKGVVISIGFLVLLDSFGVSITPILASLGIGSLAVALALQPTLENFFSGMQILIDRSVKIGQFIKLESGEEGYVEKITWRSTRIHMLSDNVVIIPNKFLVTSRVTNYYYPNTNMNVLVDVGVHYNSDLEKVERVTLEVADEVMKCTIGAVSDFKASVRYCSFDDSCIKFKVVLRVREIKSGIDVKHEFIKRLQKRYLQEGIVIPYPIVAVNYAQEK